MELYWQSLDIEASIEHGKGKNKRIEKRLLLNNLRGILRPGEFTAILGPSGSGKTTLLNFLSGRLASENLKIYGDLFLNGEPIKDVTKFSSHIAYI